MQGALDLAPDVLVAGRYRLSAPLARGATASVWRATDVTSDREVAVKVLRDDGVDPALRSRAEREASILTGIAHPNLVEVLDSGDDGGRPYLVMALLEGEPLDRIVADRAPLPVDEAVTLVADVAEGLGVAHEQGVVHRDVKPGNIVCHEQVPTLVDFGIARAIDATTLTRGLVVGTASYLAPEQAQGLTITPAADVYSLACVLYELLTGTPPFTGDSPVSIALKHVQEEPQPPGDRVDIPPAVDAVIMRALAKDPARRPADGNAFAAALRDAVSTAPSEETISLAAPVVRDGTTVMPALLAADVLPDAESHRDEVIDRAPLVVPPPARRRRPVPGLAVLAALIALVVVLALMFGRTGSAAHTVPDVTNASVADATKYLEGAGMHVDVVNVHADAPAGIVVASDPAAGVRVPDGSTVKLSVSSGTAVSTTTSTTVAPAANPAPAPRRGKHHKGD